MHIGYIQQIRYKYNEYIPKINRKNLNDVEFYISLLRCINRIPDNE